jgi:hypothetical protein
MPPGPRQTRWLRWGVPRASSNAASVSPSQGWRDARPVERGYGWRERPSSSLSGTAGDCSWGFGRMASMGMTKPESRSPQPTVGAAAALSLGSIAATPKADTLAELLGTMVDTARSRAVRDVADHPERSRRRRVERGSLTGSGLRFSPSLHIRFTHSVLYSRLCARVLDERDGRRRG